MSWFEVFALYLMPLVVLALGAGVYWWTASDGPTRVR